jgi:hypothetical protein
MDYREHTKQTAHTSCDVINDFLKMYKLTTNDNYLLISKLYFYVLFQQTVKYFD